MVKQEVEMHVMHQSITLVKADLLVPKDYTVGKFDLK